MARLKLVFHVEDMDTQEIVVEKSQMILEATEDELVEADKRDAQHRALAERQLGGDHFTIRVDYGRGKYVRELCQATGAMMGRFLENKCAKTLGSDHMDLLPLSPRVAEKVGSAT